MQRLSARSARQAGVIGRLQERTALALACETAPFSRAYINVERAQDAATVAAFLLAFASENRMRKLSNQQRYRLADPTTYAAMDAAKAAGKARYGAQVAEAGDAIMMFLAGRRSRDLTGADAVPRAQSAL